MLKSSNKICRPFLLAALCFGACNKNADHGGRTVEKLEAPAPSKSADTGTAEAVPPHNGFNQPIEGYKASALGETIRTGNLELVKQQLQKGASIESCLTDETYIFDALYASIAFEKPDVLEYLIANNLYSDINKTYTEESESPLTLACASRDIGAANKMVKLLISKGANVNGTGESGGEETKTPLFEAVKQGNASLVKLLLEQGAKKDITNQSGETPLSKAEASGNTEIIEMLK